MALTPDTLTRHELNGLSVRVAEAANADLVGINGRIVVETMKTFHVDDGRRVRQVPKEDTCFEFAIQTDDAHRAGASADVDPNRTGGSSNGDPDRTGGSSNGDSNRTGESSTDEAAGADEASGSVSELGSETVGVRPDKSGPSAATRSLGSGANQHDADECQDTVYVTVDGNRLLSRPTARTERGGDSTWQ